MDGLLSTVQQYVSTDTLIWLTGVSFIFFIGTLIAIPFILVRLSGKRTVREGTSFDFVLALVLGDLVDDAVWSEVPMAQFVAAAGALVFMKLALTAHKLFTRPS